MKAPTIICLSLFLAIGVASTRAETNTPPSPVSSPHSGITITNTFGQVFINAKITEVRPDGLKVSHSKGIALIPFSELPRDLQEKHNYDPQAEKTFHRDMIAAEERTRFRRARNDVLEAIHKTGVKAHLRVVQVTDAGILATGYYVTEEEYEYTEHRTVTKQVRLARPGHAPTQTTRVPVKTEKRTRTTRHELPDRIFLVSSFPNLVDDAWFSTMIYPCGRFQYTTVMGAGATIKKYATTPEKALELLESDRNHEVE